MPKLKLPKMLLMLSFAVLSNACGHVTVYDREVCGDLGNVGAHCAHTLTNETRDIPKAQWDKERVGDLCMTPQAYNDIETAVDQFCKAYKKCEYKTRAKVEAAFARVKPLATEGERRRRLFRAYLFYSTGESLPDVSPSESQNF